MGGANARHNSPQVSLWTPSGLWGETGLYQGVLSSGHLHCFGFNFDGFFSCITTAWSNKATGGASIQDVT